MIELLRSGRVRGEDDVVAMRIVHMPSVGHGFEKGGSGVEQKREVTLICIGHMAVRDGHATGISVVANGYAISLSHTRVGSSQADRGHRCYAPGCHGEKCESRAFQ